MTTIITQHQHRIQLSRAQLFIRDNWRREISLDELAKESGASPYHFIRVFSAFYGETPFAHVRRQRILRSLSLLSQDEKPITEIALEVGFESSSSFNKSFKKLTDLSPSEFRNLGKVEKEKLIYSFSMNPKTKELSMNLNMNLEPEIIERNETKVYSLSTTGHRFEEIAPAVWQDFLEVVTTAGQDVSRSEFMGISYVENAIEKPDSFDEKNEKHVYKAAVSCPKDMRLLFEKLEEETLPKSKYAKFLLKGSYLGVWPAFNKAYQIVTEKGFELNNGPCLENYLNDPSQTKEEDLLTEILIPIK